MGRLWRRLVRTPSLLALPLLMIGAVVALVRRDDARVQREGRRQESDQRALEATRAPVFASREIRPVLSLCRDLWRDELKLYFEPQALAWAPGGIDAYFLEGTDRSSLRQVRCSARGVLRGPRVVDPARALPPAEAPPAPVEATPAPAEAPEPSPGVAADESGTVHLDLAALSATRLAPSDLAVEFLAHPSRRALLSRRWRAAEGGAVATTEPADAAFPLLVASPAFRPVPAPPSLQTLPRHHWPAEAEAAFKLIETALPRGALISEIQLEDDQISLYVASPTPAFDGKPPVPYGEKEFDEYGIAHTDWWYPREIPGFGCPTGQTLASVEAAFADARSRFASRPVASAWYSCSRAYSDGYHGVWRLQTR